MVNLSNEFRSYFGKSGYLKGQALINQLAAFSLTLNDADVKYSLLYDPANQPSLTYQRLSDILGRKWEETLKYFFH